MLKVRIKFRKYGAMKFIGHLDVMRFFQKAMRRADIPIAFTEGYSPHMIMSFAQPLGVGITSEAEYLDIEIIESINSQTAVEQLNAVMVEGIDVISFRKIAEDRKSSGMTIVSAASYKITFPQSFESSDNTKQIPTGWKKAAEDFLRQEQIVVFKKTKRSERDVDIKPMIHQLDVHEDSVTMLLSTGSEENLKPNLVIGAFLTWLQMEPETVPVHYHRLEVYAKAEDNSYVSLESLGTEIG